ncbi:hypothetical protein QTG54_005229, partial [Skeletonema marinoi]
VQQLQLCFLHYLGACLHYHKLTILGIENQITSFDDNPPFKGVVVLEDLGCPDLHRNRIRRHFLDARSQLSFIYEAESEQLEQLASTQKQRCYRRSIDGVKDLCSGHGLTGMLFAACNPPGRLKASMRVLLVDQSEPQSHSILRDLISEVCPWADLDDYVTKSLSDVATDEASIIISTHACGSLTDDVIRTQ